MSEPWSTTSGAATPVAAVPNPERARLAPLKERRKAEIDAIMAKYPVKRSGVMALLHLVQGDEGWISPEAMAEIAEICQMQPSEVMEMVSFYTMYHRRPVGKYVLWVCGTLPCALCGSDGLIDYLKRQTGAGMDEVSPDGVFTIKRAECLGACSEAPLMLVNDKMEIRLTRAKVDEILRLCRAGEYDKDYQRRVEKLRAKPGSEVPPGGAPAGAEKSSKPKSVEGSSTTSTSKKPGHPEPPADKPGAQGSREGASRAHQPGGTPATASPQKDSPVAPKKESGGKAPAPASDERVKKVVTENSIDAGAKLEAEARPEPAQSHAPMETAKGEVAKGIREGEVEAGEKAQKKATGGKSGGGKAGGSKGGGAGKKKKK